jgi:hypothetical protein
MLSSNPEISIWSAGLPRAGRRTLREPEIQELSARAGEFRRKGLRALVSVPIVFVLLFGVAALLHWNTRARISPVLIALTVITPVLILTARDCLTLARDLARDLRDGATVRYEGVVGRVTRLDATLDRLIRGGLLRKGCSETQWFEVLPTSGLVWYANGIRPRSWIRAACAETAPLPTYAEVAAEWVEPVDISREDAFHVGKRELSAAELSELTRHVRRMLFKPVVSAVVLNLWLTGAVWALRSGAANLNSGHAMFLFAVLVGVTIQVDLRLVRCLTLLLKLMRDARLRTAVIVRSPSLLPASVSRPSLLPADEFLAISGVLWTRAGAPAPWRLAPG